MSSQKHGYILINIPGPTNNRALVTVTDTHQNAIELSTVYEACPAIYVLDVGEYSSQEMPDLGPLAGRSDTITEIHVTESRLFRENTEGKELIATYIRAIYEGDYYTTPFTEEKLAADLEFFYSSRKLDWGWLRKEVEKMGGLPKDPITVTLPIIAQPRLFNGINPIVTTHTLRNPRKNK